MTLLPALPIALIAALLVASASLGTSCTAVEGTFVNQQVYPPECLALPPICTHGDLDGDLDGDYDFEMNGIAPAPDAAHPTRFTFIGMSRITLADGIMLAADNGTLDYNPTGLSPFTTVVGIYSGAGAYTGATGELVATGALDFSTGTGTGEYHGDVCV